LAILYDIDAWEQNLKVVREDCFSESHFLHACAVKTNPLAFFLKRAYEHGHGAECASLTEVKHALNLGFNAGDIIYDSPCKTLAEIKFALTHGIHLNIDNMQELQRVRSLLNDGVQSDGVIGVRINPLVGAGTIAQFSVSTGKSKFGIPVPPSGDERESLLNSVLENPWISCVHVHTGSGGMGLAQLVAGVRTAVDFALEVNSRCGSNQIQVLDIGGGLGVDFKSENMLSDFSSYAQALRASVPEIFEKGRFKRVVTEFGAALQCKFASLLARVEYTKTYDGGRIALIHAGSDLFMRACYCPGTFVNHRAFAYDSNGIPKVANELPHDIAGPLCFAGDVILNGVVLPELEVDDIVQLADVGGNSLSIRTTHCSRQAPPVYVFRKTQTGFCFQQVRTFLSWEEFYIYSILHYRFKKFNLRILHWFNGIQYNIFLCFIKVSFRFNPIKLFKKL